MKQFPSLEKLDTGIFYILELASSLSVLLLAFGLIASVANVLTQGAVLTNHPWAQEAYAWTQAVAIDASVAGVIIRTFQYRKEGQNIKMWLYASLSCLLLFTAAIVSNIESIQQTLNIALSAAYGHVFVPVEVLIWARSCAVILLIIAHAVKHIDLSEKDTSPIPLDEEHIARMVSVPGGCVQCAHATAEAQPLQAINCNLVDTKEPGVPVEEETVKLLPKPSLAEMKKQEAEINKEKVSEYLALHPQAKASEIAKALSLSLPTVRKHLKHTKGK
jgi:hypothetical protein